MEALKIAGIGITGGVGFLGFTALLSVIIINAMFFPDCNRNNRDCFLIQNLWEQGQ